MAIKRVRAIQNSTASLVGYLAKFYSYMNGYSTLTIPILICIQ